MYKGDIADYDYYVRTFGNLACLKDSEKDRKRLIFRYDRKIPDYFSVARAP